MKHRALLSFLFLYFCCDSFGAYITGIYTPKITQTSTVYSCRVDYNVPITGTYYIRTSTTSSSWVVSPSSFIIINGISTHNFTVECTSLSTLQCELLIQIDDATTTLEKYDCVIIYDLDEELNIAVYSIRDKNGSIITTASQLGSTFCPVIKTSTDGGFGNGDEAWTPTDITTMLNNSTMRDYNNSSFITNPTPTQVSSFVDKNFHLDLNDNIAAIDSVANARAHNVATDTIYFTIIRSGIYLVVQYWFFYYFNDWVNNHEGDWESASVFLTDTGGGVFAPVHVGLSTHHTLTLRVWSKTPKYIDPATSRDTLRPVLYVSNGGHGSYFWSGGTWISIGTDDHDGAVSTITSFSLQKLDRTSGINTNSTWIDFPGKWGYYSLTPGSAGPPGPAFREGSIIWSRPVYWLFTFPGSSGSPIPEYSDSSGSWDTDINTNSAGTPSNLTVDAGADKVVNVGENTAFLAVPSGTMRAGSALYYYWDFDSSDGISSDAWGATTSSSFSSSGSIIVTVTVIEEWNSMIYAIAEDTIQVEVCGSTAPPPSSSSSGCACSGGQNNETGILGAILPYMLLLAVIFAFRRKGPQQI